MKEIKKGNNFPKTSDELKPRELMERAPSPEMISDEALLAILLKTGTHGLDVIQLSRKLLEVFGSLKSLVSADWRNIEAKIEQYNQVHSDSPIKGIGHVKCLELAAAFEIGRRWARLSPMEIKTIKIDSAEDAFRVFNSIANPESENESIFVLLLDAKCHPICEPLCVVKGESSCANLCPNEIFRQAVRWGASAIVVAHNHTTNIVVPSEEDLQMTKDIIAVSKIVSIPLLDHIILGNASNNIYYSIRDNHSELF